MNKMFYFEDGSREHSDVISILEHIQRQEYLKIENSEIDDEQFLKAQEFVRHIK